jgi:hypothetical protein
MGITPHIPRTCNITMFERKLGSAICSPLQTARATRRRQLRWWNALPLRYRDAGSGDLILQIAADAGKMLQIARKRFDVD